MAAPPAISISRVSRETLGRDEVVDFLSHFRVQLPSSAIVGLPDMHAESCQDVISVGPNTRL
jgi:hypothetical protein